MSTLEFAGPAAEELWGWMDRSRTPPFETLLEGPAGTGKTHLALQFVRSYLEQFAGTRVLLMRDHRVDMTGTMLVEWEESVLGLDHPAVLNGPTRAGRRVYRFPNGSEAVLGGFNNETALFSGQYNGGYFNEAHETIEKKFETLHRALRAKNGPFKFLIADVNPRHTGHWLNQRAKAGKMHRLCTKLWHNPRFFADGKWTEDGIEYATRLKATLSGPNLESLYYGLWNNPVGRVWPEYDPDIHYIHAECVRDVRGRWWVEQKTESDTRRIELRWFVLSIDIGTRSPGCLQAWGVTPTGEMYLVREFYRTMWDHSDWVKRAMTMVADFNPQAMVSDHDQAFILSMNRALMDAGQNAICRNADKTLGKSGKEGKRSRIAMVRTRWRNNRMFILRGCRQEPDPTLVGENGLPTCFADEIEGWSYADYTRGDDANDKAEEPDGTMPDHGCDAAMYADAYVWGRSQEPNANPIVYPPGTAGHAFGWNTPATPSIWERTL